METSTFSSGCSSGNPSSTAKLLHLWYVLLCTKSQGGKTKQKQELKLKRGKWQEGIVQKKGTFAKVDLFKNTEVDVLFSHRHLKFQKDFN